MSTNESNPIQLVTCSDYSLPTERSGDYTQYKTNFDTYKGLFYMFLSCILKSLFAFLCKLLMEKNNEITSFHLLTYKIYGMFILGSMLLIGLYRWEPRLIDEVTSISSNNIIQLIIRAALSVISGSLTILSLKYMAISDVYAIYYLYPGIVIVMSYLFLKERVGYFDIICLVACFIGVICVIRPNLFTATNQNILFGITGIYIIFVFLAAVFKGVEDILIRNIGKQVHFLSIPIIYTLVGMIMFPFPMLFFTESHSIYCNMSKGDWIMILLLAIISFSYHTLLAMSIQNENVGRASMINYFQVLFMFLSDIFVFHRKVILLDYIGISIIFLFNFINGVLKAYNRTIQLQKLKQ